MGRFFIETSIVGKNCMRYEEFEAIIVIVSTTKRETIHEDGIGVLV